MYICDDNMKKKVPESNRWLIIAHCFNADGVAASQTITDRLPYFRKRGIDFIVLSAYTGTKDTRFPHYQIIAPAPSGMRYEMRFIIKNRVKSKTAQSILKGISAILCLPFYLVEKSFLQFDSQWSWFLSASIKGSQLINKYRPALLYSTAGPATTHLAAYILHKIYGLPWMAELHDPLILDDQRPRWHKYYFNRFVEKIVCSNASVVVYFTNRALENANRRHPIKNKAIVVRPGANPPDFHNIHYAKTDKIHFGHFGSLDKTRNLEVFIRALHELTVQRPDLKSRIILDVYGCELDAVSRKALTRYPLGEILVEHGRLEYDPETGKSGRQLVLEAMKKMDVLVVLHGGEGSVCYEYIPSKLYEYLLMGRPVLGLVETGTELEGFLIENNHMSVDKDDISKVKKAIESYVDKWDTEGLDDNQVASPFTVEATVNKLMSAVSEIDAVT
jgi:glycosyltransferase involved in cell wall biosynthesis